MSRTSHAARIARLKQQLAGKPVVVVYPAPWLAEMVLGHPPTAAERKLTLMELWATQPPTMKYESPTTREPTR